MSIGLSRRKIVIASQFIKHDFRGVFALALAHLEMRDIVVRPLVEDQIGAPPGWQNMIIQIFAIYC